MQATQNRPNMLEGASNPVRRGGSASVDDVNMADLASLARNVLEVKDRQELSSLISLMRPARSMIMELLQHQSPSPEAAECLALMAEAMSVAVNPRRHYSQIRALCDLCLQLDPVNDRAKLILAKEWERDKRFMQAIEECDGVKSTSPLKPKAELLREQCETKKRDVVQSCAETKNRVSMLKEGISSPIKWLSGVGSDTAKSFGCDATTLFEAHSKIQTGGIKIEGRAKSAADKISQCFRALSSEESLRVRAVSQEHLDVLTALLSDSEPASVSVMSWNAMASSPVHATDPEWSDMVNRKTENIAQTAREEKASVLVVQECPGKHVERKGGVKGSRVAADDKFKWDLIQNLDARGRWQATSVAVPCMKADDDHRKQGGARKKQGHPPVKAEVEDASGLTDHGERHVIAWDTAVWKLDMDFSPSCIGKKPTVQTEEDGDRGSAGAPFYRPPAMVLLERMDDHTASPAAFPPRMAIVSVHLKSGGKEETVEEVRKVAAVAVPFARAVLERGDGLREGDVIVVIGDFNLEPTHTVFLELAAHGFVFAGEPDTPTNQAEFIAGEGRTYDGAWVWRHSSGGEGVKASGRVVEVAELMEAQRERAELAKRMMRVMRESVPKTRTSKAVVGEMLAEYEEAGCFKFLAEAFRRKVTRGWSDHKPVCIQIPA